MRIIIVLYIVACTQQPSDYKSSNAKSLYLTVPQADLRAASARSTVSWQHLALRTLCASFLTNPLARARKRLAILCERSRSFRCRRAPVVKKRPILRDHEHPSQPPRPKSRHSTPVPRYPQPMTTCTSVPIRPIKWPDGRKMFFSGGNLANKPQFLRFVSMSHYFIPDSNRSHREPSAYRYVVHAPKHSKIASNKPKNGPTVGRPTSTRTITSNCRLLWSSALTSHPSLKLRGGAGGGVELPLRAHAHPSQPSRPNSRQPTPEACYAQPMTNCTSIPTRPIKWPDGRKMLFSGGNLANKPQFLRFVSMSHYFTPDSNRSHREPSACRFVVHARKHSKIASNKPKNGPTAGRPTSTRTITSNCRLLWSSALTSHPSLKLRGGAGGGVESTLPPMRIHRSHHREPIVAHFPKIMIRSAL